MLIKICNLIGLVDVNVQPRTGHHFYTPGHTCFSTRLNLSSLGDNDINTSVFQFSFNNNIDRISFHLCMFLFMVFLCNFNLIFLTNRAKSNSKDTSLCSDMYNHHCVELNISLYYYLSGMDKTQDKRMCSKVTLTFVPKVSLNFFTQPLYCIELWQVTLVL